MEKLSHGGDIYGIERRYKINKEEIIDFSGNINPLGFPNNINKVLIDNLSIIENYPDKDYVELKQAISLYTNTSVSNIIIGNGATEIISIFLKIVSPKKAIIVSPSYSEYENELKKINTDISYFQLNENEDFNLNIENLMKNLIGNDILILCNPNNPTGTAIDLIGLEKLANFCKENNILFMIDETYTEFTDFKDNISAISLVEKFDNIFIIRGTSKFFAVPGIRLGYGICSNIYIISKIEYEKNPWSVNSFANLIGINIFNNSDFIEKSRNFIFNQRNFIFNELNKNKNIKFYNSKSNFILCKILNGKNSDYVFQQFLKRKILIRNAKDFEFLNDKFFRFCILKKEENQFFLKSLDDILKGE